jgi:pyruvate formate lyase activating enzyme
MKAFDWLKKLRRGSKKSEPEATVLEKRDDDEPRALVLEIQRMSTEDGPGLRTTVFLKGCPLSCAWCHNPESIPTEPQVQWIDSRCLDCKSCQRACPRDAISFQEAGLVIDRDLCDGCGICAEICPSTAMELLGREWTVPELVDEVVKDRAYFEQSEQGGITVSGGEPTMQSDFVREFLSELQHRGIHTALDTCGLCRSETLATILPFVDMVLFDLKLIDADEHKKLTGADNKKILENLLIVRDLVASEGNPQLLWIRTPLIPGATDGEANIKGIGEYLAENMNGVVERWELCAFNNLCRDKYLRLGQDWLYATAGLMTQEELATLESTARKSGVDPKIVFATGSTYLEAPEQEINKLKLVKGCTCTY